MSRSNGHIAAAWWRNLQPKDEVGERRRGDRAALARLRRCASVMQAAGESATLELCRRLAAGESGLERVALLAAVLAHVREDRPGQPVARQMGKTTADSTPAMSDLRFRRLLQADTPDEQLIAFRRLVALAGRSLDVADLAWGMWQWNEADRRRWIYAYHDAPDFQSPPPAAPFAAPSASEDASP